MVTQYGRQRRGATAIKIGTIVAVLGLLALWSMVEVGTIFWMMLLGGGIGLGICYGVRAYSGHWRPVAFGYLHGLVLPGLWLPAYAHDGWYLLTGIAALFYLVGMGMFADYTFERTGKEGLIVGLVVSTFILFGGLL